MAERTAKLATFAWEGIDKRAPASKARGRLQRHQLKAELRRQGIAAKRVRKKTQLFGSGGGKKITTEDIAVFSRQLATMMAAGVPLVQSFEIVGRGHENQKMQELILAIKADVEGGTSLDEALGKHPRYFDELFCNLVQAGE